MTQTVLRGALRHDLRVLSAHHPDDQTVLTVT